MKRIAPYIAIYAVCFILYSILFLSLFRIPFVIYQGVLFYRGVTYLAVTFFAVMFCIIWYAAKISARYVESLVAALMISAAIHLSIFIVFPVTFDRSITMFMLNTLNDYSTRSCQGLTKEQMQQSLIATYILKNDAIQKRLTEQAVVHNVQRQGTCYAVTNQAKQFIKFSDVVKRIYNL